MTTAKARGRIILAVPLCILAAATWIGETLQILYKSSVVVSLGISILVLYRLSPLHPLYRFPGPILHKISELPMIYYAVRGTRHTEIKRLHDQYGRVVQTGPNTLSFSDPSAISEIYGSSSALDKQPHMIYIRWAGMDFFLSRTSQPTLGDAKYGIGPFPRTRYHEPLVAEVQNLIRSLLKRTEKNGQVNLVRIMPQYAYDSTNVIFLSGNAFSPSLLDSDDRSGIVHEGSTFFGLSEAMTHIEPLFHMINMIPRLSSLLRFEVICTEAARRRLQNGSTFKDGVSYWIDGGEGQPSLVPVDLPIETETVLIGGSETIGAISIFIMYFLLTHKDWLVQLRDELDQAFPAETFVIQPVNPLEKLVVLNAVVQETMRLGMPFSGLPRLVPAQGMAIDGKFVPGGTEVNVPIWTYHVNEEVFRDANTFDPGRWIKNGAFLQTPMLMTFGAGAFNCVGSKLAYIQLRLITAMLLLNLNFTTAADFDAVKFWDGVINRRATAFSEPFWIRADPRKLYWSKSDPDS